MYKVPESFDDIHYRSHVYFGSASNHKIYVNSALTVEAEEAEVMDAFLKNMLLLSDGTGYCRPVKASANKFYTVVATESGTDLVEWTAKAAE